MKYLVIILLIVLFYKSDLKLRFRKEESDTVIYKKSPNSFLVEKEIQK